MKVAGFVSLASGLFMLLAGHAAWAWNDTFAPGDLFVSLNTGEVQWRHADGTLVRTLVGSEGHAEGMGLDASGNLFVTHWCWVDETGTSDCDRGNTVDRFNTSGDRVGTFGAGYDCNPTSIVFGPAGDALVGQADCSQDLLRLDSEGGPQASFDAAIEGRGTNWIDLDPDGCTVFYTSEGPSVKRYDVCTGAQLADLTNSLPGGDGHALKRLPDGGVLVANDAVIARLDAAGSLVQTYDVEEEPEAWRGLDLAEDGTSFWVANRSSGNVFRLSLADGSVITGFNAVPAPEGGTAEVKGIALVRGAVTPPPDTTPPTATMTAPVDGTTVSDVITVAASASDDVGVAGVQFLLDQTPLGAEVTAEPFELAWDTRAVPDGVHELLARARDAAGNVGTSAAITVTVSNGGPPPLTRFEETAAILAPGGAWTTISSGQAGAAMSGDSAVLSNATGATATFTFSGTGVSWIGLPCEICGIANVSIDGAPVATVDTFAPSRPATSQPVFATSGLGAGGHTLVIEMTGTQNPSSGGAYVVVDAFDVTP